MPHFKKICLASGLALTLGTGAFAQERDVDGWMEPAHSILGVYNVKDMIQIPGTKWIIGSGRMA